MVAGKVMKHGPALVLNPLDGFFAQGLPLVRPNVVRESGPSRLLLQLRQVHALGLTSKVPKPSVGLIANGLGHTRAFDVHARLAAWVARLGACSACHEHVMLVLKNALGPSCGSCAASDNSDDALRLVRTTSLATLVF